MLTYNGNKYPVLVQEGRQDRKEIQLVLIPEISGDYFLAQIDSDGGYELMSFVPFDEVTITPDNRISDTKQFRPIPVAQIKSNGIRRAAMVLTFFPILIISYTFVFFKAPVSLVKTGIASWDKPLKT